VSRNASGKSELVGIGDENRLGFGFALSPWRMWAIDRVAVAVRKSAPCNETHYAIAVEPQDRRGLAVQRVDNGIEPRIVTVVQRACAVEPVGEAEQRFLFARAPRQRPFRLVGWTGC
jgi:hypothetical protein